MSKVQVVYKTTDGQIHDSEDEADRYQAELDLEKFIKEEFSYRCSGETCLDTEALVSALLRKTPKGEEQYETLMKTIKKTKNQLTWY